MPECYVIEWSYGQEGGPITAEIVTDSEGQWMLTDLHEAIKLAKAHMKEIGLSERSNLLEPQVMVVPNDQLWPKSIYPNECPDCGNTTRIIHHRDDGPNWGQCEKCGWVPNI